MSKEQEIKAEAKSMCESNYYLLNDKLDGIIDNSDIIELSKTVTVRQITNTIEALEEMIQINYNVRKIYIDEYKAIKKAIQNS